MPITRSHASSEHSTSETVTTGVPVAGDKETVVKDLKAAPTSPETLKSKDDYPNGFNKGTGTKTEQPVREEKNEDNNADSAEAKATPVVGDDDAAVTDGDKETAAKQEPEKNGNDAGLHQAADADTEAATAANGCSRSAVTDNDKTSEVKDVNEVQETEAKDLSGEVCAKRKTDDEVSGEADSTCKKNKVEAEPAEQAAAN